MTDSIDSDIPEQLTGVETVFVHYDSDRAPASKQIAKMADELADLAERMKVWDRGEEW